MSGSTSSESTSSESSPPSPREAPELEPDDGWKAAMLKTIHESLAFMWREAHEDLQRKLQSDPSNAKIYLDDFRHTETDISALGQEEFQHALNKERMERRWVAGEALSEEFSNVLLSEQQFILDNTLTQNSPSSRDGRLSSSAPASHSRSVPPPAGSHRRRLSMPPPSPTKSYEIWLPSISREEDALAETPYMIGLRTARRRSSSSASSLRHAPPSLSAAASLSRSVPPASRNGDEPYSEVSDSSESEKAPSVGAHPRYSSVPSQNIASSPTETTKSHETWLPSISRKEDALAETPYMIGLRMARERSSSSTSSLKHAPPSLSAAASLSRLVPPARHNREKLYSEVSDSSESDKAPSVGVHPRHSSVPSPNTPSSPTKSHGIWKPSISPDQDALVGAPSMRSMSTAIIKSANSADIRHRPSIRAIPESEEEQEELAAKPEPEKLLTREPEQLVGMINRSRLGKKKAPTQKSNSVEAQEGPEDTLYGVDIDSHTRNLMSSIGAPPLPPSGTKTRPSDARVLNNHHSGRYHSELLSHFRNNEGPAGPLHDPRYRYYGPSSYEDRPPAIQSIDRHKNEPPRLSYPIPDQHRLYQDYRSDLYHPASERQSNRPFPAYSGPYSATHYPEFRDLPRRGSTSDHRRFEDTRSSLDDREGPWKHRAGDLSNRTWSSGSEDDELFDVDYEQEEIGREDDTDDAIWREGWRDEEMQKGEEESSVRLPIINNVSADSSITTEPSPPHPGPLTELTFAKIVNDYQSHKSTSLLVTQAVDHLDWSEPSILAQKLNEILPQGDVILVPHGDNGDVDALVMTTPSEGEIFALNHSPESPPCRTTTELRALLSLPNDKVDQILMDLTPCWASCAAELLQLEMRISLAHTMPNGNGYRKRCLHYLRLLSKKHSVLPPSFILNDIVLEDRHPRAGGGFADVYIGKMVEQRVCLKVLRYYTARDSMRNRLIKQLCREVLVWRQLSHPNVLPFLGVSPQLFTPSFCLISPWMANGNLMVYLEKNPNFDRLQALLQVADAMLYIHEHDPPVVHGDIRGANILVADDLRCCLADFGLATVVETQALDSSSMNRHGSVRWMAPELLIPDANVVEDDWDQPSRYTRDIYAFGCTVLEICTGQPPFRDYAHVMVPSAVVAGRRPLRPAEIHSNSLWSLVEKCWAQDPSQRPSTQEVVSSLNDLSAI